MKLLDLRRISSRPILVLFLLAFSLGLLPVAAAAGDLDEIRARGTLRMICWPHSESQFIRQVDENRGFVGIDVDLMRGFAAELGVELQVVPGKNHFAQMFPDLQSGLGDLAASSLTITPARLALFDFSMPYFLEHMVVVTRKDTKIDGPDDLKNFIGAVVEGSSHDQRLRRLVPKDNVSYVSFTIEALRQVQEGESQFALVDSGTFGSATGKYPDIRTDLAVSFRFSDEEAYGIAVRKGSDLLAPLNAYLKRIEGTGELQAVLDRHLNHPTVQSQTGR